MKIAMEISWNMKTCKKKDNFMNTNFILPTLVHEFCWVFWYKRCLYTFDSHSSGRILNVLVFKRVITYTTLCLFGEGELNGPMSGYLYSNRALCSIQGSAHHLLG